MSSVKKVKWESQIAGGRLRATKSVRVWMINFFFLGKKSLVGKKKYFSLVFWIDAMSADNKKRLESKMCLLRWRIIGFGFRSDKISRREEKNPVYVVYQSSLLDWEFSDLSALDSFSVFVYDRAPDSETHARKIFRSRRESVGWSVQRISTSSVKVPFSESFWWNAVAIFYSTCFAFSIWIIFL